MGGCRGTSSRADCAAFASELEPCFAAVRQQIELDACELYDTALFAECTSRAVASVYANAYNGIECTGAGSGCGFEQSNAFAWACSFASAIAQLIVDANNGEAQCDIDVAEMAEVFATVAAETQALACTEGGDTGFVEDFQTEYIFRVETIITDATASCLVQCIPCKALNVAIRRFMF